MPRALTLAMLLAFGLGFLGLAAFSKEPDLARVKAALARAFPDTSLDALKLRPSPVAGVYEAQLNAQVFYVTGDGRFVFFGDLVDLEKRTNLSEGRREAIVKDLLEELGEQNMIVIGPRAAKRTVTVFTDVDCPVCVRFHLDVPELNKRGVKVRYLLFPRYGLESQTYARSVAVWCAADRAAAVGTAKSGGKLDMKDCPNPVERHYRLGERLGVSGTPTIFLDDGRRIAGYVPPERLSAMLGLGGRPTVGR